jgi:CheY-like chemotaxis protein
MAASTIATRRQPRGGTRTGQASAPASRLPRGLPPRSASIEGDERSTRERGLWLVGLGSAGVLALARQAGVAGLDWHGAFTTLADLRAVAHQPRIILLDGDEHPDAIDQIEVDSAFSGSARVILQSTGPSVALAVRAMKRGAVDILAKPFSLARLERALREAAAGLLDCERGRQL